MWAARTSAHIGGSRSPRLRARDQGLRGGRRAGRVRPADLLALSLRAYCPTARNDVNLIAPAAGSAPTAIAHAGASFSYIGPGPATIEALASSTARTVARWQQDTCPYPGSDVSLRE